MRKPKPMNEIIVNPDGKRDKTILVSKDDREMHIDVNTFRTNAKIILYANASANNLSMKKRVIGERVIGGQNEEIDKALELWPRICDLIKQDFKQKSNFDECLNIINKFN